MRERPGRAAAIPRPTRRGVALAVLAGAALAAGGLAGRIELVFAGLSAAALLLLSALVVLLAPRPREARRALARDRVPVGSAARIRTTLRPLAAVDVRDAVEETPPGVDLAEARLESEEGRLALDARVVPRARGRHRIGPLRLLVEDPLGLARARIRAGGIAELVATPAVIDLDDVSAVEAGGESPDPRPARRGQGADDLIPRPYAPGDTMRRVHWRASARHGALMVRDEESDGARSAVVVLDLTPAPTSAPDAASLLSPSPDPMDVAVSAVASVAVHLGSRGFSVEVVDQALQPIGRVDEADPRGAGLLDALALVEPRALAASAASPEADVVVDVRTTGAPPPARGRGARILLSSASDDDLERAAARGWRVAELRDDVAAAWRAVRGGRRP
ncbi:DUF58 domain-containing protein [Microbacterium sp. gxy059]|uniref:DUF58 domain-containing protein n=1 Tax=Microbacterium sp. gxy059 TaxID=2957199 RepID=UPI003D979EAA